MTDGVPAPLRQPEAYLGAWRTRARRQWVGYSLSLLVVIGIAATLSAATLRRGESAHTDTMTAVPGPAERATLRADAQLRETWRSADTVALGQPYLASGRVLITVGEHGVDGRDAATGESRWHYHRDDRTVCSAAQNDGLTIVLFRLGGDCLQATALDTRTGQRRWDRTFFEERRELNGTPHVVVSSDSLLYWTPSMVWAVTTAAGTDRWIYPAPDGCRNTAVVGGSSGVAISQACDDGDYLLLRNAYSPDLDDDPSSRVRWRVRTTDVTPVAVDGAIIAVDVTKARYHVYSHSDGTARGTHALARSGCGSAATPSSTTPSSTTLRSVTDDGLTLLWLDGCTWALTGVQAQPRWARPTAALPSLTTSDDETGGVGEPVLLVADTTRVLRLDARTGARTGDYAVPALPDSLVVPAGPGLIVTAADTVVYR